MSQPSQPSTTPVERDAVEPSQRLRLVVMFDRLGPYHVARLNALTRDFVVTALECFGESEEYAWQKVAVNSFHRLTLFPEKRAGQAGRAELSARVRAALADARPEAVAIPGWFHPGARAALQWCVEQRVPAVLMSESTAHDAPRSAVKEWIKARIVGLFSAALVGGRTHADYLRQLGFPAARIFTGYDVVDNEHFSKAETSKVRNPEIEAVSPSVSPISAFQRFSVSDFPPSPYFLASARFIEKKNLPVLLQAYAEYRALATDHRHPGSPVGRDSVEPSNPQPSTFNSQLPPDAPSTDAPSTGLPPSTSPISALQRFSVSAFANSPWPLVLLGDGPLRETLNTQLSTLNLRDCVHLPGFKQYGELPAWYAGAGAFVHASTHEPWGLVVNEAMAAGLPVLVSNRCGCAPDLVEEGRNGFTFDPTDARQLAALLSDMAQRPDRAAMGRESQRIISRWSPAAFATGMKSAVDCACSGPTAPGLSGRVALRALLRS